MALSKKAIGNGFILSGITNIGGVLILSRLLTNEVIPKIDPDVMSRFGLLMIVVWGLAFFATAKHYEKMKWLVGVFVIEKLVYALNWSIWISQNNLSAVYEEDLMAGIFYTIYGINDWLFFVFFAVVFAGLVKKTASN